MAGRSKVDELENTISALTKTVQRLEGSEYADYAGMKKRIKDFRVRIQEARKQLESAYKGDTTDERLRAEIWGENKRGQ